MVEELASLICQISNAHPLRVAIDGVDASGKTTLAKDLSEALTNTHRQIIQASVDNFHNPNHIRKQKGELSPIGFYYDSYNYPDLIYNLLAPLGPGGNRRYRTAVFDYRQDKVVEQPFKTAAENAILLMDGIFLLRPLLIPYWEFTVYIKADFTNTFARGVSRDTELYGSGENAARRYRERYIPGQQYYLQTARPLDEADVVIDNNNFIAPKILRSPSDQALSR